MQLVLTWPLRVGRRIKPRMTEECFYDDTLICAQAAHETKTQVHERNHFIVMIWGRPPAVHQQLIKKKKKKPRTGFWWCFITHLPSVGATGVTHGHAVLPLSNKLFRSYWRYCCLHTGHVYHQPNFACTCVCAWVRVCALCILVGRVKQLRTDPTSKTRLIKKQGSRKWQRERESPVANGLWN